ncbi:MAG: T9SS type A sorting domain-containing protein [Bacteroidetes bacterium]|nr:T9SS type A sorting domain-containing protein [Bacteroidota bacterium]
MCGCYFHSRGFEKYNITLFPNPNFGGTIYFSKLVINADISIHTSDGALVTSYRNFTGNEIRPNDKLLSGLYFITLTDQHNSVTKKLIIYDENE